MPLLGIVIMKKRNLLLFVTLIACAASLVLVSRFMHGDQVAVSMEGSAKDGGYVVFAMNDLGMHCIQPGYSSFLILPPANTLKVQVFKKGGNEARLIDSGIRVSYEVLTQDQPAQHTDFWRYAKDYGYDVPPNVGITGNGMKGTCTLSPDKRYYEAKAIPVVPYNDATGKRNPYQLARVTVTDAKTGRELAVVNQVVLPVSDEMYCSTCHGKQDTDRNILQAHDKRSGTTLVKDLENGVRHKCADCHKDNAIGEPGKPGIPSFSLAIHGFHAGRMGQAPKEFNPKCYTCHPGLETKCNRGRMAAAGIKCDNPGCHGGMENVAETQRKGREAWLQEPDCSNPKCHARRYASNPGQLYRNSYLEDAPSPKMNGLVQCESCHNGTHSEWKSTLAVDNAIPISLLGYASYMNKCTVCHKGKGRFHR